MATGSSETSQYRKNHYVPEWLQKRFLVPESHTLWYLDLQPPTHRDRRGRLIVESGLRALPPSRCFAETDLYTEFVGNLPRTEIERVFFGAVDNKGSPAVQAFSEYSIAGALEHHEALLDFLGMQRFRTPRGLAWISERFGPKSWSKLLATMMSLKRTYHAIWSEAVWQVVDASASPTKFILSDHPVTFYNRHFGPKSDSCKGSNDPDLRAAATHTLFALDLNHALVLTHLTWARNPYQDPGEFRPHPVLDRTGVFKAMDVQIGRMMSEQEVLEVNFIIKSRAMRYVAAAEKEWLFPEKFVSKSDWRRFGDGYLLMPDPRLLSMGGTIYMVDERGRHFAADEYGRMPTHPDFEASSSERDPLARFQGEFARLYGPMRRGRSMVTAKDLTAAQDSPDLYKHFLAQESRGKNAMRGARVY